MKLRWDKKLAEGAKNPKGVDTVVNSYVIIHAHVGINVKYIFQF